MYIDDPINEEKLEHEYKYKVFRKKVKAKQIAEKKKFFNNICDESLKILDKNSSLKKISSTQIRFYNEMKERFQKEMFVKDLEPYFPCES